MVYLAFLLTTLLAADLPLKSEASELPTLSVSISPHGGPIPAGMANGRPVYKFMVIVVDPEQRMSASGDVLLQAGMTRELLSRSRPPGQLRGVVKIERAGAVRYRVAFRRGGRDILSAASYVHVRAESR